MKDTFCYSLKQKSSLSLKLLPYYVFVFSFIYFSSFSPCEHIVYDLSAFYDFLQAFLVFPSKTIENCKKKILENIFTKTRRSYVLFLCTANIDILQWKVTNVV